MSNSGFSFSQNSVASVTAHFSLWIEERIEIWPNHEIALPPSNTQHEKKNFNISFTNIVFNYKSFVASVTAVASVTS